MEIEKIEKTEKKIKIAFHDNQLCERGTTVSLYDYAYYNKYYLGNESIIMYCNSHQYNFPDVIEKFSKEFTLRPYGNWQQEADNILKEEKCDILYMQKAGEWDNKIASKDICKTVVHCVFNTYFPHGDVYATISPYVMYEKGNTNIPVVPYMINLPDLPDNINMRKELNIPDDAVVFGRHGGYDQFNIPRVPELVVSIANNNPKIYFLLCNTRPFCENIPNIIYIDKIIDLNEKVRFINTCDAMLWARIDGETFGLSIGEFSSKNKPVIAAKIGSDAHFHLLGDKGIWYNSLSELHNILTSFNPSVEKTKDWNAFRDYTYDKVMDKFKEVFIKPLEIHADK